MSNYLFISTQKLLEEIQWYFYYICLAPICLIPPSICNHKIDKLSKSIANIQSSVDSLACKWLWQKEK